MTQKRWMWALFLLLGVNGLYARKQLLASPDFDLFMSNKIGYASYFDLWTSLLKHDVEEDKVFATKMGLDTVFDATAPNVKALCNIRTKAVWGNNKVIKVSQVQLKDPGGFMEPLDQSHLHTLNLPAAWFREVWFEVDLSRAFNMTNAPYHSLTIGSFPFQVGRGIALGDVYAFNPTTLGFYTDGTVDQYAYAIKFTGGFSKKVDLSYDIYLSILQNNSTSLSETLAQTQAQAFKKNAADARGFGKVNYVLASRFNIFPYKKNASFVKFEPYVVHNYAPEQTVEFYADAESNLTTLGCAGEFQYDAWEGGFDGAANFGHQTVKGWDRMVIQRPNIGGLATYVFSDVYTVNPNIVTTPTDSQKLTYDPANKTVNNAVFNVLRSTISNGEQIDGTTYYNSLTRFRAPYQNKYKGFMFVADLGYWAHKRDIRFAMTAGVASGDLNPNANLKDPLSSKVDGDYKGFVGLQELYAGNRVKSVFVMGGTRKLVRPLSTPFTGALYSSVVDSFSNLAFTGLSLTYFNKERPSKFTVNPNLLVYWEQFAGNKFDMTKGLSVAEPASKFLGTEFNIIAKGNINENVTLDVMISVFQPGSHYFDVKGQPFNQLQRTRLEKWDPQNAPDHLPILWYDSAYSFASGLTYSF